MPEGLPPSALNSSSYPKGPNGMAQLCRDRMAELEAALADCPKAQRRPINRHLHTLRGMVRWCETRAGYVATPEDAGLLEPGEMPGEDRAVLDALAGRLVGGI